MTAADITLTGLLESDHLRGAAQGGVIASTVGTTIEWYDLLLYKAS